MYPCPRVGDGIAVPYPEKMLPRFPVARREIFYIFCLHSFLQGNCTLYLDKGLTSRVSSLET